MRTLPYTFTIDENMAIPMKIVRESGRFFNVKWEDSDIPYIINFLHRAGVYRLTDEYDMSEPLVTCNSSRISSMIIDGALGIYDKNDEVNNGLSGRDEVNIFVMLDWLRLYNLLNEQRSTYILHTLVNSYRIRKTFYGEHESWGGYFTNEEVVIRCITTMLRSANIEQVMELFEEEGMGAITPVRSHILRDDEVPYEYKQLLKKDIVLNG